MEFCIADRGFWMTSNFLKLNQDMIELIIFSTKQNLDCAPKLHLKVEDHTIKSKTCMNNLGEFFDPHLTSI